MKTIISTVLVVATALMANNTKDYRLCKIYEQKVINYRINLIDDEYAKVALKTYEDKMRYYCKENNDPIYNNV